MNQIRRLVAAVMVGLVMSACARDILHEPVTSSNLNEVIRTAQSSADMPPALVLALGEAPSRISSGEYQLDGTSNAFDVANAMLKMDRQKAQAAVAQATQAYNDATSRVSSAQRYAASDQQRIDDTTKDLGVFEGYRDKLQGSVRVQRMTVPPDTPAGALDIEFLFGPETVSNALVRLNMSVLGSDGRQVVLYGDSANEDIGVQGPYGANRDIPLRYSLNDWRLQNYLTSQAAFAPVGFRAYVDRATLDGQDYDAATIASHISADQQTISSATSDKQQEDQAAAQANADRSAALMKLRSLDPQEAQQPSSNT